MIRAFAKDNVMQPKKLKFSQDVIHTILNLCALTFNLDGDKEIENLFNITPKQFKEIVTKIINELPDNIFEVSEEKLEEIKNIFAREFIFFQLQEKGSDPHYQDDLSRFTHVFSRDIEQRINSHSK